MSSKRCSGAVDPVVVLGLLAPLLYAYRAKLGAAAGRLGEWVLALAVTVFVLWFVGMASTVCYQVTSGSGEYPVFGLLCTVMLTSHLVGK